MSLLNDFGWAFGFGFGAKATDEAIDAVSNRYRAKDFDPVVRKDLLDIMTKGQLANIAYPFPKFPRKQKKPIFFVRHKIFTISIVLYFVILRVCMINRDFFMSVAEKVALFFGLFWIGCIIAMFVKKMLRGGKKATDMLFQSEFIAQGQKYWQVREYVRQALAIGELNVQGAYVRIRNTELGRQLPESDTELEAKAFNSRHAIN